MGTIGRARIDRRSACRRSEGSSSKTSRMDSNCERVQRNCNFTHRVDVATLRKMLRDDHILLQHEWPYRTDIDALGRHTQSILNLLSENSRIQVSGHTIKIERDVVSELLKDSGIGSFVLVGQPGGFLLYQHFFQWRRREQCDVYGRLVSRSSTRAAYPRFNGSGLADRRDPASSPMAPIALRYSGVKATIQLHPF
jgi:hypothetical protein